MNKLELLAPAGSKQAMIGAINAGADAVYLAGKKYGARAFAHNFEIKELKEMISYAHLRGVLVYVTLNTLIFNHQIDELIAYADELVLAQVDALILQDFGMLGYFIKRYPKTDIHVSTQANTHNIEQVKFYKALGVKRIVMARETPIEIIRQIKKEVDIELEVFIHGALCTSYSGQCLMSVMAGGRSANSGECAQPCRLPYKMTKDNQIIQDEAYLLSSKDLMTIEFIEELIAIGVDSFKIEGRMRKPEYVVQAVLSYRKAINHVVKKLPFDRKEEINGLKRVFNREYTKGYLFSEKPEDVINSDRPNHQGIPLGVVVESNKNQVKIKLDDDLHVADGIRYLNQKTEDSGDLVSRILLNNQSVISAHKGEVVTLDVMHEVELGAKVIKTKDMLLESQLEPYFSLDYKKIPLIGAVSIKAGDYIEFSVQVEQQTFTFYSEEIIDEADKHFTTDEDIKKHLSKLGDTPFYYKNLYIENDQKSFVPIKWLNDLRKKAINEVNDFFLMRHESVISKEPYLMFNGVEQIAHGLTCKISTLEQLNTCYALGIQTIYYEHHLKFEIHDYPNATLIMMVPRIMEEPIELKRKLLTDTISAQFKNEYDLFGNTFLNVTNIYTARFLSNHFFKRVTLSPELGYRDVMSFSETYLKRFKQPIELEMVVYGRTELMITKHSLLTDANGDQISYQQFEKNQYALKNKQGKIFPLMSDAFDNLRILSDEPLNLIAHLSELKQANINTYRLEFTNESKTKTSTIVKAFIQALNNENPKPFRFKSNQGRFIPKASPKMDFNG